MEVVLSVLIVKQKTMRVKEIRSGKKPFLAFQRRHAEIFGSKGRQADDDLTQ